jgi:hypothetical protein
MTEEEQLQLIKTQTLQRIQEITAAPKPTYKVGDQEFRWNEYLKQLQETVAWCDGRLQSAAPFEIVTLARG